MFRFVKHSLNQTDDGIYFLLNHPICKSTANLFNFFFSDLSADIIILEEDITLGQAKEGRGKDAAQVWLNFFLIFSHLNNCQLISLTDTLATYEKKREDYWKGRAKVNSFLFYTRVRPDVPNHLSPQPHPSPSTTPYQNCIINTIIIELSFSSLFRLQWPKHLS